MTDIDKLREEIEDLRFVVAALVAIQEPVFNALDEANPGHHYPLKQAFSLINDAALRLSPTTENDNQGRG